MTRDCEQCKSERPRLLTLEGMAGCAKVKDELLSALLMSLAFLTVALASNGFMTTGPLRKVSTCQKGHKRPVFLFIKLEYDAKAVCRKAALDSFLAHATTTDAVWPYLVRVLYCLSYADGMARRQALAIACCSDL